MDPVGPQKKIKSNQYHEGFEKLLDDGGEKENYGYNVKGGKTKPGRSTEQGYKEFQGTVRGATKHTYGVNGENDND